MSKVEQCKLCGGEVMYYGKKSFDYEAHGEHYICKNCDVMIWDTPLETWNRGYLGKQYKAYNEMKAELERLKNETD